ncbi:hypothetical protein V3F56_13805 [Moorellaceae bacterium AZ2]
MCFWPNPQKILNSFSFSPIIKMGAVRAFIEMGLFKEGEPVRTNIDGEERLVEVRSTPVVLRTDEKLDAVVERAFEFLDKAQVEEAIELLRGLQQEGPYRKIFQVHPIQGSCAG